MRYNSGFIYEIILLYWIELMSGSGVVWMEWGQKHSGSEIPNAGLQSSPDDLDRKKNKKQKKKKEVNELNFYP